ncbi:hypothetical protein GCM10027169_06940 [Gordonia jinhuaensis]|uniref:Glutathione peroxidase n=1 Tax=Gordonia jinhuaensis TaxID=1517702 RepID=A0A916SWD9_9ACTN|nr:hypothetical protein GCM10011489_06540 [Gordonia jinhuaensis]
MMSGSGDTLAGVADIETIPLTTIDGQTTTLGAFGGPVLVVNVASKCGLTPHSTPDSNSWRRRTEIAD